MAMARLSPTATRIWGITAALGLVTTAAIFGLAQPVNAHNSLVASTPAEGETLTSLPESFSVTTSDTLLAGGVAAIEVTDAAGLHYGDGCAAVDGPSLAMGATLGEPGGYTMTWQAVSADGHAIDGIVTFAWQPGPDAEITAGTTAPPVCGVSQAEPSAPADDAAAAASSSPEPSPSAEQQQDSDTGDETLSADMVVPWIVGGLIVVAIAAGVILLLTRRRDRN